MSVHQNTSPVLLSLPGSNPDQKLQLALYIAICLDLILQVIRYLIARAIPSPQSVSHPPFTIIVCAHNEEKNLRELLPLLIRQSYPVFEIIIVADRCTDGSMDLLREFEVHDSRVRIVEVHETAPDYSSKKFALTRGIAVAQHDWLLFTDADCRPCSEHWIRKFAEATSDSTNFILGVSPYFSEKGILNALIRYETFVTAISYICAASIGMPYMAVGRNLAYRKSVFNKTHGFGRFQKIMGGDDDLFVQLNAKNVDTVVLIGRESLTYSVPKHAWKEYFQQKVRHLHVSRFYKKKIKNIYLLRTSLLIVLWSSCLYLVATGTFGGLAMLIFSVFLIIKAGILRLTGKKMGIDFNYVLLPLVDLLYLILIPAIRVRAAFSKKIRWKS